MANSSESADVSSLEMEAAIDQFCGITGATNETARITLEACNWNIELAINMHVDANDVPREPETSPPESNAQPNISYHGDDDVRPPIPPVRQVLVEDYPSVSYVNQNRRHNSNSVFDAFRNFEAEARWHEEMVRPEQSNITRSSKRRTLEDLFRPPLDLICRGSLEYAREEGQKRNKWLLINVQNQKEFSCQVLNRDVWSHAAVKSIVLEHFIFWQIYHDSTEGQRFMQFYNVADFPYIAILDPRTGERLRNWNAMDPVTFCDLVTEFLTEHPTPNGSGNVEIVNLMKNSHEKTVYDESEEMQIKAAIAASLQDAGKHEQSKQFVNDDDDSDLETFDSDNDEPMSTCEIQEIKIVKELSKQQNVAETKEIAIPPETITSNVNVTQIDDHQVEDEDWHKYLGPENGKKIEFAVRFPDGRRENITFPAESRLKALSLYLSSKGYSMSNYDLVMNFPRRNLKDICESDTVTFESAGIHARDTLYVQLKT